MNKQQKVIKMLRTTSGLESFFLIVEDFFDCLARGMFWARVLFREENIYKNRFDLIPWHF
jgi:hypothetical protein